MRDDRPNVTQGWWRRWRRASVALLGCVLALGCGSTEPAGLDTSPPGLDAPPPVEDTARDSDDEAGDVASPLDFLPQQRWKPDTPPARQLAEECWLRPFLSPSGLTAHQLMYWSAPDVATNGELVFVATEGPVYRDSPSTGGHIHAVDTDGVERWRVGPNEMHALERSWLAVDGDGALIIARTNEYHDVYSSYVAKVDGQGALLWSTRVRPHEDDVAEVRGLMTRVAVDDDNNIYFGMGLTVVSLGPDGELRWSHLLEARSSERTYAAGPPAVIGDTVWSVGGAGVYAFSRDGNIEVWRPGPIDHEPQGPEPRHVYRGLGAVLADGRLIASFFHRGVDVLNALGLVDWTQPDLPHEADASLIVGPSDLVVGVRYDIYAFRAGGDLLWRGDAIGQTDGSYIDDRGQLLVLVGGHHLDLYDAQTGDRTGAYDIGRAGSGPLGVVLREGELIVPVMLEATDGRRVAALQCVKVPVGLPAPGLWSHKHGDQRLSRSYTPTPIEVDDPSPEQPEPDPPSDGR